MRVKYVNLSICLISYLHIKDSIERHGDFCAWDKENEKLQGVYPSLLDKHFFFLCKSVHTFSEKHLHYVSNQYCKGGMTLNICVTKLVLALQFVLCSLILNNIFQSFKCFLFVPYLSPFTM